MHMNYGLKMLKDTFELDLQNHRLIKKITVLMTNDYISALNLYMEISELSHLHLY
jgi:hypothetical protein